MGQILPVMKGRPMNEVVNHCLPKWRHWERRREFRLSVNMRAGADTSYADWVAKVRNGTANFNGTDTIYVPKTLLTTLEQRSRNNPRHAPDEDHQAEQLITALVKKVRSLTFIILYGWAETFTFSTIQTLTFSEGFRRYE